jgi:hypothetical protein
MPRPEAPAAEREGLSFDPLFADIERQLDAALRKPASIARPRPTPGGNPAPSPQPPASPPPADHGGPAAKPEDSASQISLEEEMASLLGRDLGRDRK